MLNRLCNLTRVQWPAREVHYASRLLCDYCACFLAITMTNASNLSTHEILEFIMDSGSEDFESDSDTETNPSSDRVNVNVGLLRLHVI